ncbi:MAG: universal stress protein [Dehalococcoidia bacterium]
MGPNGTRPYERILVPLDGSATAEEIIPYVLRLARDFNFSITLFHVLRGRGKGQADEGFIFDDGFRAELKTLAGEYLARVAKRLRSQGLTVNTVVAFGSVATRIGGFAKRNRYDLIAMSTRGHSGVKRWAYGSIANKVLHSTDLPLLLIRPERTKESLPENGSFQKVLVPLDGSELAEAVLPTVRMLSTKAGYDLTFMRVVSPVSIAAGIGGLGVSFPSHYLADTADIDKHYKEIAADYLKGLKWELMAMGLTPEAMVAEGDPAEQIINMSQQMDRPLIVMATHGRSGVSRWVLGSVTDRVLRGCSNPVLLIHPQKSAASKWNADA